MNIGIMQLSNNSMNSKIALRNTASEQSAITSSKTAKKTNSFEEVLNKVVSNSSRIEAARTEKTAEEPIDTEKLEDLLGADSMEEVIDILEIPHDEGLLTIQTVEDGKALAFDEMMQLDNLLSVLGIEPAQLLDALQQLSGGKIEELSDVWGLINSVLGQQNEITQQLVTALQGEQKVTPKQAEQILQFLKLAQVTGKNTDLFSEQNLMLEQLKDLMKNVKNEVNSQSNIQLTQTTESQSGKVALQGFEQVVQKIVKSSESVEKTETTESSKIAQSIIAPTANTTKTVTITLPAEKGAQSEALAKEIQNLLNRSQISNGPGTTKLLLKLYPENLGSIRIEIMQQDGVLSARLLTSTAMGKELLDNQLHQLKTAFANANIQMDRIDIAQSLQETDRNLKDQNHFGQQFKQQSEHDEHEQDDQEDDSETMSFSDYLINEEV